MTNLTLQGFQYMNNILMFLVSIKMLFKGTG